jgi:F0F1-type ATP synthase membrane subunit b/b'
VIAPPNFSLLFIIACFWLVYFIVSRLLVKPLGETLDERHRRAAAARERFEAAQSGLKEALARCERELAAAGLEAGKQRQGLRAEGEKVRAGRLAAAREQAQGTLATLGADLEQAVAQARGTIRTQAGSLGRLLANRLAGRGAAA